MAAQLVLAEVTLQGAIPILRIFDVAKARDFYIDYLGFAVDFEHRFGDDFPLYMQVSRDGCAFHLSEHHGDSVPGAAVYIRLEGLREWHAALRAKPYRFARPDLQVQDWGMTEMMLTDPFGNRLRFAERTPPSDG